MDIAAIPSPAHTQFGPISGHNFYLIITVLGLVLFSFIVARRIAPLRRAQPDPRFNSHVARLKLLVKYWFAQWKHPRYRFAGIMHMLIFAGFLVLIARAFSLLISGVVDGFVMPGFSGEFYNFAKDYAATLVFIAVTVAAVRRLVFKPARYAVPARYGKGRSWDAIFLLGLIGLLMFADALFEGSAAAASHAAERAASSPFSLPWLLEHSLAGTTIPTLATLNAGAFLTHELAFFFLLCYRPFGIQFHVETSLFSIYFGKLDKEILKPVRWGVIEDQLDQLKSFGVKRFEDFTWKHMLDFYSCADCGRCSDQCPANAVGRPLSPRFLTIKARDYAYAHYPVFGQTLAGESLIGTVYSEDEIWSCTTCGACEAECPMLIEYIDKVVDLRRGLVDEHKVPQSLQKPLKALETRGNPYGKSDKKRADWTQEPGFKARCPVSILNRKQTAETLYFVDSITSYDDRMQSIGRAAASVLAAAGESFGILGTQEKDSGHEVRRFGEEMLYLSLRDQNTEAIRASGANRIIASDPHAFNALKHDYSGIPLVEHVSQTIARAIRDGRLQLGANGSAGRVFVYHDACYLGRHNGIYDAPREAIDAIPGARRVEMSRCKDRSFCCGGGGLMLFYEPKEDERMGVKRVRMAAEAGADTIVTACPFCMANLEDAVKVAALEEKMRVVDLTELIAEHVIATPAARSDSQLTTV